jgi:nucleoside phosphorylase
VTDAEIIDELLERLFSSGSLPLRGAFLNAHEEVYDRLSELVRRGLVDVWLEEFLMVLPNGLAIARSKHVDELIRWTDEIKTSLGEAHRSNESKTWTIAELAALTGLREFSVRVALLYRGRFLGDLLGPQADPKTGFFEATQLTFEVRLPRETLASKVARAKASGAPSATVRPSPIPVTAPHVASRSLSKDEKQVIKAVLEGDNRQWPTLRFLANASEPLAELTFNSAADADTFSGIADALGFVTSRKDVVMLSEAKGAAAAKLAILTLDAVAGELVQFLERRARRHFDDEWTQLRTQVVEREAALNQISPLLQLDLVHRWLDITYGVGGWECDLRELRAKPLLQVVIFELTEKRSGTRHLLATKGDHIQELPLAWRLSPAMVETTDASPSSSPNTPLAEAEGSSGSAVHPQESTKVDVGIITIRDDEAEAIVNRLSGEPHVSPRTSRHYLIAELGTTVVAVLKTNGQGNLQGHSAARDFYDDFRPRWLLLVGIGGGTPSDEFSLGDVVVSTRIVDLRIEARFEDEPTEYLSQGGPLHPEAANLVAGLSLRKAELRGWNVGTKIGRARPGIELEKLKTRLYGSKAWRADVKESLETHFKKDRAPLFVTAAIASSDRLIKDATLLDGWKKHNRDVRAVEMEAAGVYVAAHEKGMRFIAIRGISDIVGLKRKAEWTAFACETPAAFVVHLLVNGWFSSGGGTGSGSTAALPSGSAATSEVHPTNSSTSTAATTGMTAVTPAVGAAPVVANPSGATAQFESEQKLWLSAQPSRRTQWASKWPSHAVFSFSVVPKNVISLGTHSDLRTAVHNARVDGVGLTFPNCVEDRFTTIQNRPGSIQGSLDLGDYQELWQLHNSGAFWYTSLVREGGPRQPGELSIEFEVVPWMIGLAVRYARRLFAKKAVERLAYSFVFEGMKDRRLTSFKPNKLRNQYKTEEERIEVSGETTLHALTTDWPKLAGDAVREIFSLFNWEIAPRTIEQELDEVRGGD